MKACERNGRWRKAIRCLTGGLAGLLLGSRAAGFPLTMGLGNNAGAREFHFCQLDVTPRAVPCGGALACLEFEMTGGPVWLDVQKTASLSEAAAGTTLLDDMFQYACRMSLIGDAALLARVRSQQTGRRFELRGYWYPSGRRLLLLDVGPADGQ